MGNREGASGAEWRILMRGCSPSWFWLAIVLWALLGGASSVPSSAFAVAPVIEEFEGHDEEWAAEVSATSATLRGDINPEKEPTTYRFEYDTSEYFSSSVHGAVIPTSPTGGDVGEGEKGVVVEVHPQDLKPDTVYYFRVAVKNAKGEEAQGSGRSFTTQPASGALTLPGGRMWELVSPATKDGALILPIEEGGGLVQAAEGGGAITYISNGPAKSGQDQPAGNAGDAQLLSVRGSADDSWSTQDISTPHEVATGLAGVTGGTGQEYKFFSPDLSVGLLQQFGSLPLSTEAPPLSPGASEKTIYLRDDKPLRSGVLGAEQMVYRDAEQEAADPEAEAGYLPLVTGCRSVAECRTPRVEELADVLPGTQFGSSITGARILDATPDLSHSVIFSSVPLKAGAEKEQLYEWGAGRSSAEPGQLQLVSVLTKSEQASAPILGGGGEAKRPSDTRGAVSNDGSYVIFSDKSDHLFMRDMLNSHTVQLDELQQGTSPGTPGAKFQFASNSGSKVFFTDGERLTARSTAESTKPDLYECDMVERDGELECILSDLTISSTDPTGAGVQGYVLAGSDSDSYLYFVATGELTEEENERGEKAEAGEDNLYMLHYDEKSKEWKTPVFIAILSNKDGSDWGARSSPDSRT